MEITTQVLNKMLQYQACIKAYTEYVEAVKEEIRKRGSFCIDTHVCSVQERVRETLGPLSLIEKHIPRETLEAWGMVRKTPFKVVVVTPIGTSSVSDPTDWHHW
jgi:hypothetical protein